MRRPSFIERVLTAKERAICKTASSVAGRWAAKEAVAKAAGIELTWQEVEILPDELGAPVVSINSSGFDAAQYRVHVSITHERNYAAAVAVVENIAL